MIEEVAIKNDIKEEVVNNTTSADEDHGETWAVASESQHETPETKGGDGEAKVEANANNANNKVEVKVDMDELMVGGDDKTFPTMVPDTWVVACGNQHETQDTEGGAEGKLKADVKDNVRAKVLEAVDQKRMDSPTLV